MGQLGEEKVIMVIRSMLCGKYISLKPKAHTVIEVRGT